MNRLGRRRRCALTGLVTGRQTLNFKSVIVRLADYGARGIAMVSLLHEGVIKLVRDRPAFAADLLGQLLDVEVPRFTEARRP